MIVLNNPQMHKRMRPTVLLLASQYPVRDRCRDQTLTSDVKRTLPAEVDMLDCQTVQCPIRRYSFPFASVPTRFAFNRSKVVRTSTTPASSVVASCKFTRWGDADFFNTARNLVLQYQLAVGYSNKCRPKSSVHLEKNSTLTTGPIR